MSNRVRNISGWPVMSSSCASCPFKDDGSIEVRNAVTSRIGISKSQICHHPRGKGKRETHLCRGAREWHLTILHRLEFIEEATDQAFAKRSAEAGYV